MLSLHEKSIKKEWKRETKDRASPQSSGGPLKTGRIPKDHDQILKPFLLFKFLCGVSNNAKHEEGFFMSLPFKQEQLNGHDYNEMKLTSQTRVDVSDTFSADQLWFRILSGLFQRCSLPENLWTALIQLWTALKTEIFRAKNQLWNSWFRAEQRWFSLKQLWNWKFSEQKNQRWIRAVSALIFSETELIFSETALKHQIFRAKKSALNQSCFSADFLWNRAEQRWFSLTQRWKTKNPEQGNSALNQYCFSADIPWKRADTHWSLLKQLSSFLIFPWDNAEHPETS